MRSASQEEKERVEPRIGGAQKGLGKSKRFQTTMANVYQLGKGNLARGVSTWTEPGTPPTRGSNIVFAYGLDIGSNNRRQG